MVDNFFVCCKFALLFVIFAAIQHVSAINCNKKHFVCSKYTQTANFSDPDVLFNLRRRYAHKVANSPLLERPSQEGQALVDLLLEMADGDSPRFVFLVFRVLTWGISFLAPIGENNQPSLCTLAQMINSSNLWETQRDGNSSAASLRSLGKVISDVCLKSSENSLSASGCGYLDHGDLLNKKCYKRGHVYALSQAWDLFGRLLPCGVKQSVFKLYDSDDYYDNALAALVTFSLTTLENDFTADYDQTAIYVLLDNFLDTNSSICCCEFRKQTLLLSCNVQGQYSQDLTEKLIQDKYLPEC